MRPIYFVTLLLGLVVFVFSSVEAGLNDYEQQDFSLTEDDKFGELSAQLADLKAKLDRVESRPSSDNGQAKSLQSKLYKVEAENRMLLQRVAKLEDRHRNAKRQIKQLNRDAGKQRVVMGHRSTPKMYA